jgi:cobalt-zinc-cadmium resistance protein CzcA
MPRWWWSRTSRPSSPKARQEPPLLHLVFRATREVAAPVASGILIIVIVFLPLLTLQGLEGKMFGPVALTIVFALSASLLLSLTVVPVLASFLLKRGHAHEPWLVRKLQAAYAPMLAFALARGRLMVAIAGASPGRRRRRLPDAGQGFMPTMDEGDMIMQLEKLPSISLDQTIATDLAVQQAILKPCPR